MTEKKSLTAGEGCLAVLLVLGAVALIQRCIAGNDPEPELGQAPAAAPLQERKPKPELEPDPPKRPSCVIAIPNHDGKVPLLPTEDGFDEYGKAAAQKSDDRAMLTVLMANDGFLVAKGTPCVAIETGFASSRVRVLEGPHAGKAGWLPNEWRLGE
jgi:hypothetical protein